jgi:Short C-terminal domain/Phospholipase_D-nuclease N-terminal
MDYPLLNAFMTMLWFFLWVMWFVLLFRVIGDLFRDDGVSGWGKVGWTVLVCALPFLGVFTYLIARGGGMGERETRRAREQEKAFRTYVRETAAGRPDQADALTELAGLHDHGHLTDAEYARAKAEVLTPR